MAGGLGQVLSFKLTTTHRRRVHHRVGLNRVAVPVITLLGESFTRGKVHPDDVESSRVAKGPLKVVEQTPHEVPLNVHARVDRVVAIVITNSEVPHYVVDNTGYNHYSLLRTMEDAFDLPHLAHAGDSVVTPMTDLFMFRGTDPHNVDSEGPFSSERVKTGPRCRDATTSGVNSYRRLESSPRRCPKRRSNWCARCSTSLSRPEP